MNENEKDKKEPKKTVTAAEVILVGLVLATVDIFQLISLIISPIPVVGQAAAIISTAVGACVTLMVQFYLTMRKAGSLWFLASGLVPARSVAWIIVAFFANHPRLKGIADKAVKLAMEI